jgi:hypothetical protein
MPIKRAGKRFDILEMAEEIRRSKPRPQYQSGALDLFESRIISEMREHGRIGPRRYFASAIWYDLLSKTRNYPKPAFLDEISEVRQEVDTLKVMVRTLTNTVTVLLKEKKDIREYLHATETNIDNLCKSYIQMLNSIEIAKELYTTDTNSGIICWTIVDAEPFNSNLLEPIYNAQVDIYTKMESTLALEFRVVNLKEINDSKELLNILPPSAKLIWQR